MNNKGFAITGILYTIFILFIMILLSILSGLNTRKNILEKSIMSFSDDYKITDASDNTDKLEENVTVAPFSGKYVYRNNEGNECVTYLKEGSQLNNPTFVYCDNNNKNELEVYKAYKFNIGE